MGPRHLVLTLLLAASLAPLASAEPAATATATQAAWQDGAIAGHVLAFRFSPASVGAQLDGAQPIGFHVTGPSVAWTNREADLYSDSASVVGNQYALTRTEDGTFADAVLSGQERRADGLLYVLPVGDVTVEGSCGSQMQAAENSVTPPAFTGPATPGVDTSRGLSYTTCPTYGVVLRGSFQVVLWEVDALVQSRDGTTLLQTGKLPGGVQDGAPDTRPFASRARQTYLTVQDGAFAWTDPNALATVFLADATLTDAGTLLLSGASATFPAAGLAVTGERIEVSGVEHASLVRRDGAQPVAVTLEGVNGVVVDGRQVIAPKTAVAIHTDLSPWLAVAGAVGALAALLVAWVWVQRPRWAYRAQVATGNPAGTVAAGTWRERRGVGYSLLATRAHTFRRPRRAALYATLAIRLFPALQEAWVLRALAREAQRKWRMASEDHRHLLETLDDPGERAASACHLARLHVLLQEPERALDDLRAAYDHSAAATLDFIVQSHYDALTGYAWFDALRQRARSLGLGDPSVA